MENVSFFNNSIFPKIPIFISGAKIQMRFSAFESFIFILLSKIN